MKSLWVLLVAWTLSLPATAAERLTVAVSQLPPCIDAEGGQISGFSADLWHAVAHELRVEYRYAVLSFNDKLAAARSGDADVAIGCISLTPEREEQMDFSVPVMNAGFRAVTLLDNGTLPRFSEKSRKMVIALLISLFVFSHLMWWSERGRNAISDRYFPGIFESIWFSIVTMSTVGYGDIAPRRWLGRISAALVILTGVTTFGVIFGQFAADALADRASNPVDSVLDLNRYRIATKANTSADGFLKERGIQADTFEKIDDAYGALLAGRVQLVLFDAPSVERFVQRHRDQAIAVGPLFRPHYYAFALPAASPLRERIDRALLHLQQSGLHQTIQQRWFTP
ncbi:transporter substrate-binding domain-containing protein [Endothiovibrio diazotrophicus]